ncbi:MAG: sigma-70 family RNA polymerase sigma factor [Actinomycetota bacterium]
MQTRSSDVSDGLEFEEFYRAEFPNLVRAMFLLVPDDDEAQELAQEAMVRVYERWNRVRSMDRPGGYVYQVAVNLNRRRIRSLAMRTRRLLMFGGGLQHVETTETRRELSEAIGSLSMRLREAFMLVDWLGMSSEEAGRILQIEPASVRSRVHRARNELRSHLTAGEDGHG